VQDCLKNLGLTERKLAELRQEVEELRGRHNLYGFLYSRFSRSDVINTRSVDHQENDLVDDEDDSVNGEYGSVNSEGDLEKDEGDGNVSNLETVQIFEGKEWEIYLKEIDSERSILTLQDAMTLPLPLSWTSAQWLFEIKGCALFMEKIWHQMVKSTAQTYPLCKEDLQVFVHECATEWKNLARTVAGGTVSFKKMEEISRLQPDPKVLSRVHLQSQPIEGVETAYRNFKNLQELRHIIGPFVAALRFFSIKERGPIDNLYHFVDNNLLKQWESTTLAQITETGILRVVNEDLNIDPERPETRNAMQFVSSLMTDGNRSPLIEWLREKDEKDMEAMGKILQGTLLVAYGNLLN